MPRLALSYQITNNFIWRASVSRGYSTPTTAEIRPTDQVINTSLQAEDGWNYETGFRLRNADESMFLDASIFYYHLNNAIDQQQNANGTTYYINAGGTKQPGFELYFTDWIVRQNNVNFIRGLQLNASVTLDRFSFESTHNQLTGVPNQVIVGSAQVRFPGHLYVFGQYNYTAKMPLNDASTAYAPGYHLVEAKAGWESLIGRKTKLVIYAGADNILNQKYSLGNDLNAAVGGRYYNAAAPRNYYVGARITL
jgi:iron complex outermembrane receptor protein